MIKIKDEYLDVKISCPATRKDIICRFIPSELYSFYKNKGYDFIFEEIVIKPKKQKIDDLPSIGDE
jgi:hypothetical protein